MMAAVVVVLVVFFLLGELSHDDTFFHFYNGDAQSFRHCHHHGMAFVVFNCRLLIYLYIFFECVFVLRVEARCSFVYASSYLFKFRPSKLIRNTKGNGDLSRKRRRARKRGKKEKPLYVMPSLYKYVPSKQNQEN